MKTENLADEKLFQRLYRYRSGFYRGEVRPRRRRRVRSLSPVNMLDTVTNSRPPTTDTNGAASANINNQVSITPNLCPTDEPHELLCSLPIPSQPLPNYKPKKLTRRVRLWPSSASSTGLLALVKRNAEGSRFEVSVLPSCQERQNSPTKSWCASEAGMIPITP